MAWDYTPRIYVASLSDYNNGTLHGTWIELEGLDVEDIQAEVQAMLAESPENKICQFCAEQQQAHVGAQKTCDRWFPGNAEEWAIHDYELGGIKISEWEPFEHIVAIVAAVEQYDVATVRSYLDHFGDDADLDEISEHYHGVFKNKEEFAYDFEESCGWWGLTKAQFETIEQYIDWETVASSFEGEFEFDQVSYDQCIVWSQ